MKKLLIILDEHISSFLVKGEIIDRYYNPGNYFGELHIFLMNDDVPDEKALQRMAGTAKVYIYNLPASKLFVKTLAYRYLLLKKWAKHALNIVDRVKPDLIRCYGNSINAYLAYIINVETGINYVISLHVNLDESRKTDIVTFKDKIKTIFKQSYELVSLKRASLILPVYTPITWYLDKHNISNYEVMYNVVNQNYIYKKLNYNLSNTTRVISVGRQFVSKDCSEIIKAIAKIDNIEYHLFGDGPFHDRLVDLSKKLGVYNHKVFFTKSVKNDELCNMLHSFDIFCTHTEYAEISKSVIEALLTGLPIVINKRNGNQVGELSGDHVLMVENEWQSYVKSLNELISSVELRKNMGEKAKEIAWDCWAPEKTEAKFVEMYRRYVP